MDGFVMETEFDKKRDRAFFNKFGLLFFFGSIISFGIQIGAKYFFDWINPNLLDSMDKKILGLMLPVYVIAYPFFLFLISRLPKGEKIEEHKLSPKMVIFGFMMAYSLMYMSNLLGTVLSLPKALINEDSMINPLADLVIGSNPWIQMLVMVILAPIFEELIFRKFLIDRVIRYGEGIAIIVSGLMFSLFHGNISQGIYAFVIGILLAFIYVKTGRARYGMIIHFLINFMGSIASGGILKLINISELSNILLTSTFMQDPGPLWDYCREYYWQIGCYVLYTVFLQAIILLGDYNLIANWRQYKLTPKGISIPKGQRFRTIIVNPGMIIFCVTWIGMSVYSYIVE